jgi:hypothetical protein
MSPGIIFFASISNTDFPPRMQKSGHMATYLWEDAQHASLRQFYE